MSIVINVAIKSNGTHPIAITMTDVRMSVPLNAPSNVKNESEGTRLLHTIKSRGRIRLAVPEFSSVVDAFVEAKDNGSVLKLRIYLVRRYAEGYHIFARLEDLMCKVANFLPIEKGYHDADLLVESAKDVNEVDE
jgi:hypothetical protein